MSHFGREGIHRQETNLGPCEGDDAECRCVQVQAIGVQGEDITEEEVSMLQKYVSDPDFTQEKMASKSAAAANLCTWVVNIYNFNRIYVRVKPLMDSLEAARRSKADALARLEEAEAKVACVEAILVELGQKLDQAVAEKQEVEEQASALKVKADLAKRLVGGLSSEKVRWGRRLKSWDGGR